MRKPFQLLRRNDKQLAGKKAHLNKLKSLICTVQRKEEEEQRNQPEEEYWMRKELTADRNRNKRRKRIAKNDDDISVSGTMSVVSNATTVKAGCSGRGRTNRKKVSPAEEQYKHHQQTTTKDQGSERLKFWKRNPSRANNSKQLSTAAQLYEDDCDVRQPSSSRKEIPLTMKRYLCNYEPREANDVDYSSTYSTSTTSTLPISDCYFEV